MVAESRLSNRPIDGCFVGGISLIGCQYDAQAQLLVDPSYGRLVSQLPGVHLSPTHTPAAAQEGVYDCPLFRSLSRRGRTLKPDFVLKLGLPTDRPTADWVKAGAAAFISI